MDVRSGGEKRRKTGPSEIRTAGKAKGPSFDARMGSSWREWLGRSHRAAWPRRRNTCAAWCAIQISSRANPPPHPDPAFSSFYHISSDGEQVQNQTARLHAQT